MSETGILYAMVADGTANAIAECQRAKGNHGLNAKKVLQSIPKSSGERRSFTHQKYCYNIQTDQSGTIYLCVTEEGFSRVTAFNFLEAIRKSCGGMKGNPQGMFTQLKKDAEFYSDPKNDKITKIKNEINQVQDVMIENIERILERGDKIDNLIVKTEVLEKQSGQFKSNATTLKNKMLWKKILMYIIIAAVVALVIFLIVLFACSENGVNFRRC
jgi:vesicle-associated membrane protein 7